MKRILVVEDDTVSAKAYQRLLEGHGFAVDVTHDGESALRAFHSQRPDLVLLDLMLPKVPGTEIIRNIRANQGPQSIPIVVLTNAMLAAMIKVARQAGADLCLMKGDCSLDQLLQEICKILGLPAPGPPAALSVPSPAPTPPAKDAASSDVPSGAPAHQQVLSPSPLFQANPPGEPSKAPAPQFPSPPRPTPPFQPPPLFQSASLFPPAPLFEGVRPVHPPAPARSPAFSPSPPTAPPGPPQAPAQSAAPAPAGAIDSTTTPGRAFRDPFATPGGVRGAAAAVTLPVAAKPPGNDIANLRTEMRQAFLEGAPQITNALRGRIPAYVTTKAEVDYLPQLFELYQAVEGVAVNAEIAGFVRIERVASALQSLLRELFEESENITASSLRTAAHAAELLASLFERAKDSGDATLSALVLVVDDEAISRRAVCSALEQAQLKFISVDDPEMALRLCRENRFELIFSDVEMPGKTGFEMCAELRVLPLHRATPFVFVTGLSGFESRARSALAGGNDLIAKPFLLSELAVKALTYLIKNEFKEKSV